MEFLKKITPQFLKSFINLIFKRKIRIIKNFENWEIAVKNSSGYDNHKIYNKTIESFKKVLNKEAKFERDSVLFFHNSPDKKIISIIKKLYKKKNINICDFGGSLASLYFQNRDYLDAKRFHWHVVEQTKYVQFAKKNIFIKNLSFHKNLNLLLKNKKIDIIIFSSVLQYLKSPFILLDRVLKKKIKNIVILRTPFFENKEEIKIQIVPKHIYEASYPIRIFSRRKFMKFMKNRKYEVKDKISTVEQVDNINYKGYLFTTK